METSKHKSKSPSWGMLMFIACGVAFGCYFGSYMRFPIVPLYARRLGIDTPHIGFINSAFFLMAGFLSFPLGLVSDRVGRKLLACLGLLILTEKKPLKRHLKLSQNFHNACETNMGFNNTTDMNTSPSGVLLPALVILWQKSAYSLVASYGNKYRNYQSNVPMLIPRTIRPAL